MAKILIFKYLKGCHVQMLQRVEVTEINISVKLKGEMSRLDMKGTGLGGGEIPITGVAKK